MALDIQPLDVQPLDIQPLDIQPLEEDEQVSKLPGQRAAYDKYLAEYEAEAAKPSIPGATRQPKLSEKQWQEWQDTQLKDHLLGIPEAALSILTSIPATINAVPPALIEGIRKRSSKASEDKFNELLAEKTYAPRSDYGNKIVHNLGGVLQAFGPNPYVPRLTKNIGKAKVPTIEERLAEVEGRKTAEKATTQLDLKPLEFTEESPLAVTDNLPYEYKGGIDAPELASREGLKQTFDPTLQREQAANAAARTDIEALKTIDPEAVAELRRPDLEQSKAAFEALEAEKARVKRLEEQAAWTAREESIPQRRMAEERAARMEESLQRLEEELSQERVSKGQQRKASRQQGALDFQAIVDGFPDFANSVIKQPLFRGVRSDDSYPERTTNAAVAFNPEQVKNAFTTPKLNTGMARGQRGAILFAERTDKNVDLAKKLHRQKYSPATIWDQTGVYRDVDGKYKTVLADSVAQIKPLAFEKGRGKLSDFLYHPELFKIYPELKDTVVVRSANNGGAFLDFGGKLTAIHVDDNLTIDGFKKILLHEVQHAIQKADNFSKGGNSTELSNKYNLPYEKAHQQYLALHGEQEARFTEANIDVNQLSVEARVKDLLKQGKTPSDSYDAPVKTTLNRGMARGQRGAIDLGPLNEMYQAKLAKIADIAKTDMFTPKPNPEQVVAAALAEGKDGRGFNLMESGSSLAAAKRQSALIQGVSQIVQHEVNKADLDIRTSVFPAEKALRSLPRKELEPLMKVFLSEARNEIKYSAQELADMGLSIKQLAAYNDIRTMFKETLAKENEARIAQGKKPVTEAEYYSSSRWQGDFRQDFHDASGKHVWSLAGKSTRDLRKQRDALLKQFPDLVPSKERIINTAKGEVNPLELYKTMLEVLGDNDPAVARVKEWYQQSVSDEAASTLAQEKHFKAKAGVRGFVGDRPGKSGTSEALNFFQQQITYAKNGMKWAAMQRAGADLKNILADEALVAQQPNNVAYARDYVRHNLGFSEAQAIAGLENSLRELGISPHEVRNVVGNVKGAWITQKLVASPGFMLSNLIQSTAVLPHMMNAMVQYGGNPLTGLIGGMAGMLHLGAGHFMSMAGESMKAGRKATQVVMPDFMNAALKYAEDNGVTSRSTYDESPIQSAFNPAARAVDIAAKATITTPETLLRSFAFSAFASQLRGTKAFKTDLEVFRKAEEMTNMALGDYRQGERPMMFSKLGIAGDIAGTLSTFPMNYYNQWNWAVRESFKGNVAPALTMFAVQAYVAGAMGIPGFQDMDKAFDAIKAWAAENNPKMWKQIKDWSPKQMAMDYLGESAVYGNVSTDSGLALTSRVAAPSVTDMLAMPTGMATDLAKQAGNLASFATGPSKEKFAKAAIESAPVGLQGYLETGPLRDITSRQRGDERLYMKRGKPTPEGDFARRPEDEQARAWGLRTQRETLVRDETYRAQSAQQQTKLAVNSSFDAFYKAAVKGDVDKAKSYARLYSELSGKPITNEQIKNQIVKEWTTSQERALTGAKQLEAIKAAKRMMDIINE